MDRTKTALAFLVFTLCTFAYSAENCFLQNYVNHRPVAVREARFKIPPTDMTVTRVIPQEISNPRLKQLVDFTKSNNIILIKEGTPPLTTGKTVFITVSPETLASESELTALLERKLSDQPTLPLNVARLPARTQNPVTRMQENFNTTFLNETEGHGRSLVQENTILIKLRHPDNLRVSAVVSHEITHNTTDRKIFEALNPVAGANSQGLTHALAGREMQFRAKIGKTQGLPHEIVDYNKFYRADEVEALLREMAQAKKDGLSVETSRTELKAFMNAEELQIRTLLKNRAADLKITTEEASDALRAGRRQRRVVTTDAANFSIEILVKPGLSASEERVFVEGVLNERIERLDAYRRNIAKRFSEAP